MVIQDNFFNKEERAFSIFADFKWHSQRWIIRQPCFFKAFMAFISLAMLEFILLSHQSVLVLGTTKYLQFLCPCQKQPWIKMTVLYFGKTTSGFSSFGVFQIIYNKKKRPRGVCTALLMCAGRPLASNDLRLMLYMIAVAGFKFTHDMF